MDSELQTTIEADATEIPDEQTKAYTELADYIKIMFTAFMEDKNSRVTGMELSKDDKEAAAGKAYRILIHRAEPLLADAFFNGGMAVAMYYTGKIVGDYNKNVKVEGAEDVVSNKED